jgi:ATP-dependent Clp protease adaptor protein ClpS
MSQQVLENKPEASETSPHPNYRVILINDDHNSFEHVASCLSRHIPGMSRERALKLTVKVHNEGAATVWVGPQERAQTYRDLLKQEGLTVTVESEA